MRTIRLYQIGWDNDHAAGVFKPIYTSKAKAIAEGRGWKRSMVEADDNPKEAAEEYSWEVLTMEFYVERVFEWPGHSWAVYDEPKSSGHSPMFKECPYKHVIPTLIKRLQELQ